MGLLHRERVPRGDDRDRAEGEGRTMRPIIFSKPMILAILEGRKTQTRRIMKPQPFDNDRGEKWWLSSKARSAVSLATERGAVCALGPYGYKGDRLWVKETWRTSVACDSLPPAKIVGHGWPVWHEADGSVTWHGATSGGPAFTTPGKTRSPLHMPTSGLSWRAYSKMGVAH